MISMPQVVHCAQNTKPGSMAVLAGEWPSNLAGQLPKWSGSHWDLDIHPGSHEAAPDR